MNDIRIEKFSRKLNCGASVTVFREIVCAPEYDDESIPGFTEGLEYDEEN